MTDLATAAGAAWTLANGERNVVIDASAETVDEDESDAIEAEAESIVEAAVERAEESDTDVSLGAMIDLELADRGFDDVRLALVTGEIRRSVEHEYAADLDAFSAQWGQEGDDVAGDEVVFNQGYAQIIDYLAAGLDISLGATVTSVTLTEDGVTVAGSHGVIAASAVIVTLPLGVLQAGVVAFDPPLPDPHRTAIARLGMGTLDKVVLQFDRVFWPDVEFIGFTRPDGRFIEWLNLAPATGQPVLMAFTAGQPARDQEALSDEELIAEATAMIIAAFAD
jgi:predicted NAD/FAD-dependent oxidoreductase